MRIIVNGENSTVDSNLSVSELLTVQNVKMPDMVSVELNGEILKRQAFDSTVLNEGVQIEFLYFMGGGIHRQDEPWSRQSLAAMHYTGLLYAEQ